MNWKKITKSVLSVIEPHLNSDQEESTNKLDSDNKSFINEIDNSSCETYFGGIPVSELDAIAKTIYHGEKAYVREGFLYFKFRSKRGQTSGSVQLHINDDGKLEGIYGYYPGESWNSADLFVNKVNLRYTFEK